jgi:hypothetical protein
MYICLQHTVTYTDVENMELEFDLTAGHLRKFADKAPIVVRGSAPYQD